MKKINYIGIGVIIVLVIIVSYYTIFVLTKNTSEYHGYLIKESIRNSNPNLCLKAKSYTEDGGDYTRDVTKEEAKNECYAAYAEAKLDIKLCDKISKIKKSLYDDELYEVCIYKIQKALGNLSLRNCEKMISHQNDFTDLKNIYGWYTTKCIQEFVASTKNYSICDQYFKKYSGDWNGCAL